MGLVANTQRRLADLFPGFFNNASSKHDHYTDFGWHKELTFDHLYAMYMRNSLARAGVDKTISKTWQSDPEVWQTEDRAEETPLEKEIRQLFDDLRVWQGMAIADRRAMVGGYAGLILRFRDGAFDQPVAKVPGGLNGFAGVIPVWKAQLRVSEWDTDPMSEGYGTPKMFQFNETAMPGTDPDGKGARIIKIHPDRVLVWSVDGTLDNPSDLAPGYNDLVDLEKIKGAGGEGFWKNAKASPILEAAPDLKIKALAEAMNVSIPEVADAMNEQVNKWQSGFDNMLMVQGMEAKTLSVTLPNPEHFFAGPVQSFAASLQIPVKILLGSQTGERASTEDANEWSATCMSRRKRTCLPLIREFVRRLEKFGILPPGDWTIGWDDLTEATSQEKLARSKDMAAVNQTTGMEVFEPNEIREAAGYQPITFDDPEDMDDPSDDDDEDPPSQGD